MAKIWQESFIIAICFSMNVFQKIETYFTSNHHSKSHNGYSFFNPFHASDLVWYPLKTSENLWFSNVFRGHQEISGMKWVKSFFKTSLSSFFVFFLWIRFTCPKLWCHCEGTSYFWLSNAQKMKFSIMDFLSKCDQIQSFLRIWSYLLKKSLMENFIFVQ